MELVACAVCGRHDDEPLYEKDGFQVVRCRRCRLMYVNPRLTMDTLAELYNDQKISWSSYYVQWADGFKRSFGERLALIEKHRAPGRLLDLGCSTGSFMEVAIERGWTARGLDVNRESVQHAREVGLDVICGTFPHPELDGAEFELAVMSDFIEHVPDPRQVLKATRELLAKDGYLFLTTPDAGALVARLTGRRWWHLKPTEHLVYFDRKTIRELLADCGFEIVDVRAMGRVRNLGLAIDLLQGYSRGLHRVSRALVPKRMAERVFIPMNPGDEMGVLARVAG
jgi:2-polyprenyl-3-methyl-5-hydroxy-6-metoxy-1,4-benzoquinol methylase